MNCMELSKLTMIKAIELVNQIGLQTFSNDDQFILEPYINGREQGFAIKKYLTGLSFKVIAFAENRNCDSEMSIFVGYETDFEKITNVPKETAMWNIIPIEKCLEFVKNQMSNDVDW